MNSPLKTTPLLPVHERLGARLVPFAGFQMPIQYKGVTAEHLATRSAAGLFDVSHMGQIVATGHRAVGLVDALVTGDVSRLAEGKALYTCACNEQGNILDDLIIYKLGAERTLIVCNASNRDKIVRHFREHASPDVLLEDRSDRMALLALQGPKAFEILARAGTTPPSLEQLLGSFSFTEAEVAKVPALVARTGYTGEDGVEIFCSAEDARALFSALLEAGLPLGLEPSGLAARDTLRLEARLSLYGNDIDETTNPVEAGLSWTVAWDKPSFLGKAALERQRASGPSRRLVGFEMTGRGVARHGYPLLDSNHVDVGACTSGGPSPSLGKNIGLGYLPTHLCQVGTPFFVDCRGKAIEAVVVKTPFYKRARLP